jgi:uncharacterized protein (DUF433 family)
MEIIEVGKYLISDPAVCHGKLTFKGTRVLVGPVLAAFANGENIDYIVTKGWPTITKEGVKEALMLAIHKFIDEYPGYPEQPWHDEVARMAEEYERKREERRKKRLPKKKAEATA